MKKIIGTIADDLISLAPLLRENLLICFNSTKTSRRKIRSKNSKVQDIATYADHAIGKLMINKIYKKYSEYLKTDSEEKEERVGKGEIILRFDPLDGSKHFVKGFPFIGSTASLISDNIVQFAMVIDVFGNNIYHAIKGKGAFINNRKIKTKNGGITDNLSFIMYEAPNSKTYSGRPDLFKRFMKKLTLLQINANRTRNIGLSTLSICYVADNSSPAYIDFSGTTKLYDIEAPILVAKESGAVIGNLEGKKISDVKYSIGSDKKIITDNLVVANPKAFAEINRIFSGIY